MKVYIGNRSEYSTFSLIQKAYWISYKCSITESCIIKNQQGKPYFRDLSKPFFNVSHSGQYIGCVFDTDEVGLDIQR